MSVWDDIKARFPSSWRKFADDAVTKYGDMVKSDVKAAQDKAANVILWLNETDASLTHSEALLAEYRSLGGTQANAFATNLATLRKDYDYVSAGTLAGARKKTEIGVAPAVVLILSVAGLCFAVAVYEYCQSLRDQARLQEKDLAARVEAMRGGKTLQPSTVSPPPGPDKNSISKYVGVAVAMALGTVVLAVVLPSVRK